MTAPPESHGTPDPDPLGQVRHDLKTPINQIIGYSEMLAEDAEEKGEAAVLADLQKIVTAARTLLDLIDKELKPGKISLPAAAAPAPPPTAAAEAKPTTAPVPGAAPVPAAQPLPPLPGNTDPVVDRLLVVDDNEMNRDMLSRRLKSKGYIVEMAEDGQQALDMLSKDSFDLILLDVMMPGISGIDVLRAVRQTKSRADLPIIMATAKDQSDDIVEALKLGANDYVTKPIDFPVCLARVQSQLALKRAQDQVKRLNAGLARRNDLIKTTFGRYLSDEVVDQILEAPGGARLGGDKRTVTILMSDLRGFSALSERLPPEQVVRIINNYLAAMTEVIKKHKGTIDEFIGDAILAIFGAPVLREDDAKRALACAVEMQLAMHAVNEYNRKNELPEIEMGIALHTGEVIVGNIGSEQRAKYGVVGTAVNLTSRIETYTIGGQILISDLTFRAAGAGVIVGGQMSVKAKGLKEPMLAHDLQGVGEPYNLHLQTQRAELLPLKQELAIDYFVIDGKSVGDTAFEGSFVALSLKAAAVKAGTKVSALTNLKLHVRSSNGQWIPGDLYGKVLEAEPPAGATFVVHFTSSPPEVETFVKATLQALQESGAP
ncbi:MAG: response regulator [Vicinamibacteria bacterium]|nr:response regulator [Vicinamibacteria bacterium]